jgi:hypothetical protein
MKFGETNLEKSDWPENKPNGLGQESGLELEEESELEPIDPSQEKYTPYSEPLSNKGDMDPNKTEMVKRIKEECEEYNAPKTEEIPGEEFLGVNQGNIEEE